MKELRGFFTFSYMKTTSGVKGHLIVSMRGIYMKSSYSLLFPKLCVPKNSFEIYTFTMSTLFCVCETHTVESPSK